MLDDLKSMGVFCQVVECGSFRGAARDLKLSPSVISHHISALEHKTGTALLYRSTRKLSLTAQGQRFYQAAKRMVQAAKEGLENLAFESQKPQGVLTIAMASVLIKSPLMGVVAAFSKQYEGICLNLKLHDTVQDLIEEGVDLTLRIGTLKDSSLKSRAVYQVERSLVAHPDLLKSAPRIETLEDLHQLPWIAPSMLSSTRIFLSPYGKEETITFEPKITVDSVEGACQLACQGAGMTSPPKYLTCPGILSGVLQEVLPEYTMAPLTVYALWQPNTQASSLTHLFKTFLIQNLESSFT